MLHLRIVTPSDLTDAALEVLTNEPGATSLVRLPGAALFPEGDLLLADVARESTDGVLSRLQELGIDQRGSIAVETIDVALSETARRAVEAAPGAPSDAVVWEELAARTGDEADPSATFMIFMVAAGLLASIGIMTGSEVSIIGAMIVGPEFGPLAALCAALVLRRPDIARPAAWALGIGLPLVVATSLVGTVVLRAVSVVETDPYVGPQSAAAFVWQPSPLSFVVAVIAGVAGMLTLTSQRSGGLIGVLVSVTTIPAAANIAVAFAFGHPTEALQSVLQLLLNIAGIVAAGATVLYVFRRRRSRLPLQS